MVKKIADQFSRFIVGGLFIFSGLIKLNDPIGTKIKMEEYFGVFAEDFGSFFHVFIPYALEIGMVMIVLEIALGVAVLIYYRMDITTILLLLLMVFFTFLTFYSAYFNKVTDCGCFGDAIKLTPWQSFWKDVVLMIFILHLFWYRKSYIPVLRPLQGHIAMATVIILSLFLGIYAIRHLPFIDFRAYRIGNHIPAQMQPEEQPVFEYVFKRKDNGEEIRSQKYLMDTTQYKYVSVVQLNEDKTKAKITDYAVSTVEGEDVTQETFQGAKLFLIMYDVSKSSVENMARILKLSKDLEGKVDIMVLTSSGANQFEAFRHEHQLAVPYYFADATVLKTIIRSNPGITLWVDGTVKGMWHHNDTPEAAEVLELIRQSE
jgi:23S rRNA pseudoU1915 N3-methylase RlmH